MIMIRNKMNLRYTTAALAACLLCACRPEMPATSTITIDLTRPTVAVDRDLYGVTPEGEAEALGGWAAEMIRNGSFEANDAEAADSIVGWRPLNASSTLMIDTRAPLSETNRRSLLARGGAVADASHSIAIARGQRFNLTCYLHGTVGNTLTISLRDSAGRQLAEPLRLPLPDIWTELHHSFTATDSARSATLDPGSHTIILKVVNTTQHDERTALRIEGGSIASSAHIISLAAPASARNTPDHPTAVVPVIRNVHLSRWPTVYVFPTNSVTILTLKMK